MIQDSSTFATNLTRHPLGYWVAGAPSEVSYPETGNDDCFAVEDSSFWFCHRNAIITGAVRQFPPEGPIFDIGGGNGFVAKGLEDAGFPVVLLEPGPAGAANAVKRGVKEVICSTVEAAGFRNNSLPAIGLFDVLEHIEKDEAFLGNLGSLMKPDGRIYLTVPAFQTLWSAEDDRAGHYRRYSRKSLARCLERAGFTVEYLTYFFWFLPLPILLCRSIPSRLGLKPSSSPGHVRREHSSGGKVSTWLVNQALAIERNWIGQKRVMPIGGSCLAVARRKG